MLSKCSRDSVDPSSFFPFDVRHVEWIRKFVSRSAPFLSVSRYRENLRITKMKLFDSIRGIGNSSAFGPRHTFFRSGSIPLPVETDRSDRYYFSSSSYLHLPFLHCAINFSSSPFPLLLPGEEGRVHGRDTLVAVQRKRTLVGGGRRSGRLPRLINSTTRNKGLQHNKTRCLRIVHLTFRHSGEVPRDGRETLVMLCKI